MFRKVLITTVLAVAAFVLPYKEAAVFGAARPLVSIMTPVKATGYSFPGPGCWKCGSGYVWVDGSRPYVGVVAVSRDMLWLVGRRIRYAGWTYEVKDLMGPQARGQIDFFFQTPRAALIWGVHSIDIEVL
jgi:3D (Asp-Asp-Asp) domain-containing protein